MGGAAVDRPVRVEINCTTGVTTMTALTGDELAVKAEADAAYERARDAADAEAAALRDTVAARAAEDPAFAALAALTGLRTGGGA